MPASRRNATSPPPAITCADSWARCATLSGSAASRRGGSVPGNASSSQRSVVRSTGASSRASPSKRGCAGSSLAMRPLSRSVPLPGSSALASRTTRSLPVRSNAARTCSSVPPPSGAASAEKSMPIGTSIPAIVVPRTQQHGQPGIEVEPARRQARCPAAGSARRAAPPPRSPASRRSPAPDRRPPPGRCRRSAAHPRGTAPAASAAARRGWVRGWRSSRRACRPAPTGR